MVVVMLITLYTTRAVLSGLGVTDYGIFNVVCGFVAMFTFLNTSMAHGTQRFYNYELGKNDGKELSKIYSHAVLIHFITALIILIIVETVGIWYLYNKMVIPADRLFAASWIFQFAMFQFFCTINSVPYSAMVMAHERMDYFAFVSILDAILKLTIATAITYAPIDKLIFYGLLLSLVGFINYLLFRFYCRKKFYNVRFEKGIDKTLFKSMLSFSGWNLFGSASHILQNQGVNLLFNAFWGPVVNAANGVAHQVNTAVNSLMTNFFSAIRPQMIKSYASGNMEYLQKMYYSTSKLTFFLVMIIAVPLIGEIDYILNFWLGTGKYPDITPLFCQLTMVMTMCNSYTNPTSIIVHATGNMKKFQLVVSFVNMSIIPIAYVAARLGCEPYVVLILSAIVMVCAQFTRLVIIKELVGFSVYEYVKKVFFPTWTILIISISIALAFNYFTPNSIVWSIARICTCALISCAIIYIIGLSQSEKSLVSSIINKIKNRKK